MNKVDEGDVSEELEVARNILGNAPINVKALVHRWVYVFTQHGFGTRSVKRLVLVEVSIGSNVDEPARRETRVVLETIVTEDMVNSAGKVHDGCIVHLVDVCTTLPIIAMAYADGGEGSPGVSQSINVQYHAPASLGDKLRLITTSVTISTRTWSARMEIWDVTHRRLVASATQVKMEAGSPPKL